MRPTGDSMSEDRTLEGLWKTARKGYLSPLEQLRAVAFRDAYKKCGVPKDKQGRKPGLLSAIAGKVVKAGGGTRARRPYESFLIVLTTTRVGSPARRTKSSLVRALS